jgi:uncharacterized membrane protein
MGKLIIGSFMFVGGLFFMFTGVGVIIGLPMFIGGLGMGVAGLASLGVTAVKTGTAAGKVIREMNKDSQSGAFPAAAAPSSTAEEIRKLGELVAAGLLTQEEFERKKAQLLA